MSYLALQRVAKSYDGVRRAVDDVSLTIDKGEFVTFLGPSGSGKTTTLMMIAGFERASGGSIALLGRSIDDVPPHRRNIGMVFQSYALFPNMSVAANVGYPLRMRKRPRGEVRDRVTRMLETVGLSAFADAQPRNLSGGQQQRVALARALVFEPDLLLLDEPLGALDKNLRQQMQIEIRRIHRELGVTTLYVTHDQSEAMTMSDRIVVFNGGRVEQVGAPLDIYLRPATRFVANFVGDNNVLDATAAEAGRFGAPGLGEVVGPPSGQADWLAVRPEMIRLAAAAGDGENRFDFAVEAIVNYGESALILGRINGAPMKMRLPVTALALVREGASVPVTWAAGDVHVGTDR
jgi:putative spermidine/putrescine transport system ATP-binding protein